jgi:hypothetical protein
METLGGFPNLPAMGSGRAKPDPSPTRSMIYLWAQYQLKPTIKANMLVSPAPGPPSLPVG